jgi:hypothetical protein
MMRTCARMLRLSRFFRSGSPSSYREVCDDATVSVHVAASGSPTAGVGSGISGNHGCNWQVARRKRPRCWPRPPSQILWPDWLASRSKRQRPDDRAAIEIEDEVSMEKCGTAERNRGAGLAPSRYHAHRGRRSPGHRRGHGNGRRKQGQADGTGTMHVPERACSADDRVGQELGIGSGWLSVPGTGRCQRLRTAIPLHAKLDRTFRVHQRDRARHLRLATRHPGMDDGGNLNVAQRVYLPISRELVVCPGSGEARRDRITAAGASLEL